MKFSIKILSLLFLISAQTFAQSSFQRVVTDAGNMQLSLTNAGTIGDPSMASASANNPSMQYPKSTGIEHLFESGIWIGAIVNGQTAVSTASVDATSGYTTGGTGFEFTSNIGQTISQRSSLTNNNYYSASAISHQDFVMDFTDANTIVPGTITPISGHTIPLNAGVHLESYAWNYGFADYFVILNYTITNNSTSTWDSVWLGHWSDLIVRNVSVTTASGTNFFNKGACGWLDSFKAVYAYDYNGDAGYTNSYGSEIFLGSEYRNVFFHPDNAALVNYNGFASPKVNLNFWRYKDVSATPPYISGYAGDDVTRYLRLSTGVNSPNTNIFLTTPDNRTELLSVGPYVSVHLGESINYVIGFVCAKQGGPSTPNTVDDYSTRAALTQHLNWASRTYKGEDVNNNGLLDTINEDKNHNHILDAGEDLNHDGMLDTFYEDINHNRKLDRYILPAPPADPIVKIVPSDNRVDIYWDENAERSIDPISKIKDFEGYNIYRNMISSTDANLTNGSETKPIATWDKMGDSIGYNNGFAAVRLNQPKYFSGDTTPYWYHYSMTGLLNGWKYTITVTAFDEGDPAQNLPSLESSTVNNTFNVWSGTSADSSDKYKVGVYPNPYTINAAWDGTTARTHKLYFYNLPPHALVTIYTLNGEVVAAFNHDAATYNGNDIDWFNTFGGDSTKRIMPGGEHAYDILSNSKQALTQGLYLFSVKDLNTGKEQRSQFAVIR